MTDGAEHLVVGGERYITGVSPEEFWDRYIRSLTRGGRKVSGEAVVEQPDPVPNDGPSMHDMVIRDILSRDQAWDLSIGKARHIRDEVAADLEARKQLGLARYHTLLQTGNGRDFLVDLYQELLDAAVYARGRLLELDESGVEYLVLFPVYDHIVTDLVDVRRVIRAGSREERIGRSRPPAASGSTE